MPFRTHSPTGNGRQRVSIRRRVMNLSLPVLLSSLFQRLVSIVDIFMVGGLGAAAIAATGLGQLLMFVVMTVFWGLATGATVVISHLRGAGRTEEARRAATTAVFICAGMTLVATAGGWFFADHIPRLMGAKPEVVALATGYIRLVFLCFGFTSGLNILSAIMHGQGNTRTPMEGVILVNILHIVVAWVLVYGRFGFPKLGVTGAAIAINLSEAAGFLYLLGQAVRRRYLGRRLSRSQFGRLWRVGYPVALERVAQQSGQLFYSKFIIGYGTAAYAAHQIGLSIESLSFMPGIGMGIAASTLMGEALGARKINKARVSHGEALRVAVIVMGGMALLFLGIPDVFIRLFTHDPEVVRWGCVFLRLVAFAQVPLALSFVYAGSLRGTGDTFFVFVVTLASMWGIRVFLSFLTAEVFHLPLGWVWGVFIIDWFARAVAFGWRFRRRDLHSVVL